MAKNIQRKFPIMLVEWVDAESIDDWTEFDLIDKKFPPVESCGLLLEENKNYIILAVNFDHKNDSASCIMKIPRQMVIKKKIIRK